MQTNKLLSEVSYFGIGGPADYFCTVASVEDLRQAFQFAHCKNLPTFILGKGSNCLFSDQGFRGLVILNKIEGIVYRATQVEVGSGYSFSLLGIQTARKGLSGLEFASGIPGTVGGAVYMNAGANQKETSECIESVEFITSEGEPKTFRKKDLVFRYRYSSFHELRGYIAQVVFQLEKSPIARKHQLDLLKKRMLTQPLKEKSAGCVFRNPEGKSAGQLIEECGLKGMKRGGAKVSEIHANFIVNTNGATSEDVEFLVRKIQSEVLQKTGIRLDMEVRVIPEKIS